MLNELKVNCLKYDDNNKWYKMEIGERENKKFSNLLLGELSDHSYIFLVKVMENT
jgi:hypothetical protein